MRTGASSSGRGLLWSGLALLAIFAAIAVFQKIAVGRMRFIGSRELLAELADAVLLEEKSEPGDWPQWRGKRRDGITSMPDLLRDWPEAGPPRKWRKPGGEAYSSFAVAGGRAFSMLATDDKEAVVCWDLANGKERWRHEYDRGAEFQYGGPRATPTLDGTRVYAVSPAGRLMCLRAEDGNVVWEHDLREHVGAVPPKWGFAYSPLVEGDLVYVMPGGGRGRCLAAYRKDTGELAWASQDDPAGYASPIAAKIGGVRQVLYFTGRRLSGVTPDEGKPLWEFEWATPFEVNAATPIVLPARVGQKEIAYIFISSGYDKGSALVRVTREGAAFDARAVYTSRELCCHFSTPVRRGDFVYGLDETRDLTCLNLRTGEVAWRFARDESKDEQDLRQRGYKKGSLIRVDDLLMVLGEDGKLALVEATAEAYRELAAGRPFRDRCWALPALAEGMLLVRDRKQVLCLDVRKR
jgi:outer membrane protein assembly factor BamB